MSNKRKLWQKFVGAFAISAIAVSAFTTLGGTAVAETATGGASIHKDNIFWWTAEGSGTDEFKSTLLAAGKTHTSTSVSKIGDSELAVTCTISNLGVDGDGNVVASGLVTKAPNNTSANNTVNDKGGWKGESHGLLYNSGVSDVSKNVLANGLTFFHKIQGGGSGMFNRLAANGVKNEVGKDETPWMDQIERFGGVINREAGTIANPNNVVWPKETSFDLSCSVTLDGVSVPLDGLVIANAESNGNENEDLDKSEWQKMTPLGEGADTATWHALDIWSSCAPASDVYTVGEDNSLMNSPLVEGGMPECANAADKSFSSSALLSGATGVHVVMHEDNGSAGSIAVGVYLSSDFGDAPQSYGEAGNYWAGTWSNPLAKGTSTVLKDMEGKTSQGGVYYTGSKTAPNYFLGTKRDTESPSSITLGTDADSDDNTVDGDEDAFPSGKEISNDLKSEGGKVKYSYDAQCTANGGTGYVGGWIDWNLDGEFDTQGEQATATCEGGKATLNWEVDSTKVEPWLARTADVTPGKHAAPFNDHSFMRLRISQNQADIKPNGIGNGEGEVEDHKITWKSPIDIEKTVTPENAKPGDKVTWTVKVKNTGNIDYTATYPMQFTDDLTDVLKVVDSVTVENADGANASVNGNMLTWTGPVPAQGEATIVYSGTVKNYADGDAINTVTSAYDGKTDTAGVKLPLLTVAKEASPSPVKKGEKVHFKVTITNEGKGTAENGKVVDNLAGVNDDGVLNGTPTASKGSVAVNGNEMTWTGTLAAGESATVEYDVIANGNADKWLKNTVSVDPSQKFADTAERQKDANTETEILFPPSSEDRETWGKKDEPQSTSLEDMFTPGSSKDLTYTLEGADENGKVTIPSEGTYEIVDGKVVFTPESGFVGDPTPVTVKATDANGFEVTGTYTPHIKDNTVTKTVKRTVIFTYLTEDGEKVREDVVQEVTFVTEVDVDPKTGKLGEPDWSKVADQEFPEVQAPVREGWTPNTATVPATPVKATDKDMEEHVVYTPIWVTYVDEDGNTIYLEKTDVDKDGNEPAAPKDPTKDGYTFTGWTRTVDEDGNITYTAHWEPVEEPEPEQPAKTYWVTYVDPDGKTIYLEKTTQNVGEDEPAAPADPTKEGFTFNGWGKSVDENGNITYTAKWEPVEEPTPVPWVKYVDEDGNTVYLPQTDFDKDGNEPAAPKNPTKGGYKFTGWTRFVDENGNVTYTAHWEPVTESPATPSDNPTGSIPPVVRSPLAQTGIASDIGIALAIALGSAGILLKTRRKES